MKETAALRRRILARSSRVAVIGRGHAGSSLARAAGDAGFPVTVMDADETRLESIEECDVVAICVPASIGQRGSDLQDVARSVGRTLRSGRLVIVGSSGAPGTTEELMRPALEAAGLSADHDFLLATSPDRADPGDDGNGFKTTPRIVGGMTREATGVAALFFGQFVDKVVQVSSCRTAETAKLLEDMFRDVNVGLVNELAMFSDEQGIDVWEVIEAASTKPLGFISFRPGAGVDGGVNGSDDSIWSLTKNKDEAHRVLRLVGQARAVNAKMPEYLVSRIERSLTGLGRDLSGARILALGVTDQPAAEAVSDSPALKVLNVLKSRGAKVAYHDPYVPEVMLNGSVLSRSLLTERSVESADCVAILTPHSAYDLDWIATHASLVFDAQNAFGSDRRPNVVRL